MAAVPPLILVGLLLAVVFIPIYFLVKKEKFGVPVKPSMYQDRRYVTPAGNTIVY